MEELKPIEPIVFKEKKMSAIITSSFGPDEEASFVDINTGIPVVKEPQGTAPKTYYERLNPSGVPYIDDWIPAPEDMIIKNIPGALIAPVAETFMSQCNDGDIDYFYLRYKRCYNSDMIRRHFCQYLNYFEKFYDPNRYLILMWSRIKYLIDCEELYDRKALILDIYRYILDNVDLLWLVDKLNDDNYQLNLTSSYTNTKNPELQYKDIHGKILMKYSFLQCMVIPLLTHFAERKRIVDIKDLLMEVFNHIFTMHEDIVDMYSKLYETSLSTINKSASNHSVLWDMQAIRGENNTTHSINVVENIILQICPKYEYCGNMIYYNYGSINTHIGFQVLDIGYEYSFVSLSSSKRDEDNNSEMDKFEAHLAKQDMAELELYEANCRDVMTQIENTYGPFSDDMIAFYERELCTDGKFLLNEFQQQLVFYTFYKYFKDTSSLNNINKRDYIVLILAAKRLLRSKGIINFAEIIGSKFERIIPRKNINKKEYSRIESDEIYQLIRDKYRNPEIEDSIISIMAQVISSDFRYISYSNPEFNGKPIDIMPDLICNDILNWILLI